MLLEGLTASDMAGEVAGAGLAGAPYLGHQSGPSLQGVLRQPGRSPGPGCPVTGVPAWHVAPLILP